MKKSIALAIAVSALALAGCSTTHHAMKWEYKVATVPGGFGSGGPQEHRERQQAFLNELGKDGWILVSQLEGGAFCFKRPAK